MSTADRKGAIGASAYWLHTWPQRYGFALIAVAAATLLRYPLGKLLGANLPFLLFFPVIWLVAWMAGLGPGVFAVFLSGVAASYLFSGPVFSGPVSRSALGLPINANGLLLFSLVGVTLSVVVDVYRRRAERLREFERAAASVKEGIIVLDRQYRYVVANQVFLGYRGVKREELIGHSLAETMGASFFETTVKPKLDECFRGNVVKFEKRYNYAGVGERDFSVAYFPIEGPTRIERVVCILQDITVQKDAERSLKLFRTLIDESNDAVEVVDPGTLRFLDVNQKACRDLGYSREELLTMTVFDIDPMVNESVRTHTQEQLRRTGFVVREGVHRRKDGSTFPVEISMKLVPLDRSYVVAVCRDISERKRVEAELRASEDQYRDLVDHSEDLVCTHDLEGRLLSVNPTPARLLGYEVNEFLKIPMRDLIVPEYRVQFDEYLVRMKATGADKGLMVVMTKTGEHRTWEYSNTLRTEGVDNPVVRGMAHDVTEKRRAELALQASEEKFSKAFRLSPMALALTNAKTHRYIEVNETFERATGWSRAELIGRTSLDIALWVNPAESLEITKRVLAGDRGRDVETSFRMKDGSIRSGSLTVEGIELHGEPCVLAVAADITERKRAEEALRKSEAHFRFLVEQASDGIFVADAQWNFVDVNSAAAKMLGYTRAELLLLSIPDIVMREEVPRVGPEIERVGGGATVLSEWKFRRKDGSSFPGEVCGKQLPDGRLQGIVRDISERHNAEEAMRQSEERFRVALKDSPITVFNQDRDLRYTWIYNPQLYLQHDAIGKTDEEILGRKKGATLMDLKNRVLKTGAALREEVVIAADGKSHAFDITIEPLFDAEKNVVGITGSAMDIARLREMTDRLQDARDKLVQEKSYLENEIQKELGFEEIIGQSPALREVLKSVRVVAPTDSTVLLLGETGTGKELVARSVHALSSRHDKTFVKLNCAAVPSGLLESELFGHERGAFTGAVSQKVGRIELAEKGTLFLDEIGELPLELQPKLLRVLQDREFERLGGVQTLHVDVRIISATNRDLHQDIADRNFREDLFYRLNVFPIELPALRQRRGDIPILVKHFVHKHSGRMGKHIDVVPEETMAVLQNWNWPGNVRELENMIERMVILSKGSVLAAPPAELRAPEEISEDSLTEMEREHIIRILQDTHGVLSGTDGAASRLGIKRTTLQSMLKRFGIELQDYRRGSGVFGPS
jgi:PAS domain S-box-containing protein